MNMTMNVKKNPTSNGIGHGNATVLIVEDEEVHRRLVREILAADGYTALEAENGEEALIQLREHPVDLILLDVVMPGMDGYEVCKRIKAEKKFNHLPIIFVTALGSTDEETKGFNLGAVDYISKPISILTLRARVKAQVELKKQRDRLEGQNLKLTKTAIELEKELEWRDGLEERLNDLGFLDGYEGIFNRRIFMHMAENYLRLAERFGCRLFLFYVGIDNINGILDTMGTEGYEQATADTVDILRNTFRQSDISLFGFFGDGEIVSLLLSSAETENAHPALGRLQDAIMQYNHASNLDFKLSISIGAVPYGFDEPFSLEELIGKGKKAMLENRSHKDF